MHRRIAIKHLIHPAIKEILGIIGTRKSQAAPEQVRAPQENNRRMGSPQAAAKGNRLLAAVVAGINARQHFLHYIVKILLLPPGPPALVSPDIGPALHINRINHIQLNGAAVNIVGYIVQKAIALIIVAISVLAWKSYHRQPVMPIHADIHIPAQMMTIMMDMLNVHNIAPNLQNKQGATFSMQHACTKECRSFKDNKTY